jgi:TolB-like protein/thioredoxin-like negative regulator of GroEL
MIQRMADNSFFIELRKRKVIQTAALYIAVAWGATEILVTVAERLFMPAWIPTLVVIAFVVGFPVAMFLAWTFDITPEGIRRTTIESRRGKVSIALAVTLLIAGTTGVFLLIQPALQSQQAGGKSVVAVPNSLAVLPFVNTSQDPADAWLSEGLSDELRDQLGRVAGIRVAARSSSVAARAQELDALAISERLRVAHLVEGSLSRAGDKLRVSVQLIEGESGLVLWSRNFERGPRELVNVQHSIVMMLVQQVIPDAGPIVAEPATLDYTANELMLLARHKLQQVRDSQEVNVEMLQESVRLYRQASEADPESALAQSRLADSLLYLGDIEAAEAPIFRALTLNPNLSEVQNTLGSFYWAKGLPEVGTAFERAVELNPNNADALANNAYWRWFQKLSVDHVAEYFARALELDPLSLARYAALGEFYGQAGRLDDMYEVIEQMQQNFDTADAYRVTGWLLELAGRIDESVAWTLRARDREPDNPDHVSKLAELYTLMGDFETALRLEPDPGIGLLFLMRRYEELINQAEFMVIEQPQDTETRYLLAFAYNVTGQFESAVHILSTTGQPDTFLEQRVRSAADIEGYFALVNALAGAGQSGLAKELASHFKVDLWETIPDWWNKAYGACGLAVLEQDDKALETLQRVKDSPRLPWLPVILDSFCFQRYAEKPGYKALVHHVEERQAAKRRQLPSTLAEFDVALDH